MLFHIVSDQQISQDFPCGFPGLSPGGTFSLRRGSPAPSSFLSWISSVFGGVTSFFVADETLAVSHVLSPFAGREVDLVDIHGIGVRVCNLLSQGNVAVASSSEFPESYHISVELSCFIKLLFPFPAKFLSAFWEGSSGHHDGELLGYPSLKGVHQDAVIVNSTVCLGEFEGSGVLVEVSIELVHAEGVYSLAGSIFKVLQDKGFLKGIAVTVQMDPYPFPPHLTPHLTMCTTLRIIS